MSGSIFVVSEDNKILELKESKYENEAIFQELIEKYPNILAGDQISPDNPRKWIFIAREMGVAPFIVGKYAAQAKYFESAQIKEALRDFVETEEAVKTGKIEDKLGVELMIIKYSQK